MTPDDFAGLPDHTRLYVFTASRALTSEEKQRIEHDMDAFVGGWKAHGAPVAGAWTLRYDRFLFVAVDEDQTALSGCSIDSLSRVIKSIEADLGITLFEGGRVTFRDERGIHSVARPEFARMAEAGEVTGETVVFDNTLQSLRPLREGKWEVPARHAWHARAFSLGVPASPEPS